MLGLTDAGGWEGQGGAGVQVTRDGTGRMLKKGLCRLQTGFPLILRFFWEDLSCFQLFLESDFRNRTGLGLDGRPGFGRKEMSGETTGRRCPARV